MKKRRRKRINLGLIAAKGIQDERAMGFALSAFRHLEQARSAPTCKDAFAALNHAQGSFGSMATRVAGLRDVPATSVRTALLKLKLDLERTTRTLAARCTI